MTNDISPRELLARLGAGEPRAGEIVSEVRTEAALPFFGEHGAAPAAGINVSGTLAAIISVTAVLSWQSAAAVQDWLTDKESDSPGVSNETELAELVSDTLFADSELAGSARYLGTFIVAGRAKRTVRMLIGLTRPVSEAQYASAWGRALAATKATDRARFDRIRTFLALLLDEETVQVEKMLLLSAVGDLIGHSIATGPSGA
ncbi:hypothetical protein [Elioraea rosea]|uniref:hypothetical protein n=1 Tax=Elioraea rosea TaxID=2492390 RepID=UPI001182FB6D|nr:hypothetical protein [Elioraea rosea]